MIWLGDLNFRIDDLTSKQIHDIIKNNAQEKSSNFSALLQKDQLNRVRREGRALNEFTELVPNFAPTYKFFVNTDDYDLWVIFILSLVDKWMGSIYGDSF